MSVTNIGVDSPLAVKAWSKQLASEINKSSTIASLIGTDSNSIIQLKDVTNKSAGDSITFGLRTALIGEGVSEGVSLVGAEESLNLLSDKVIINELAHAVRVRNEGTIDAQRVAFNLREEACAGLADWYSERLSLSVFIQLCGYMGAKLPFRGQDFDVKMLHRGFNVTNAPSADRNIIAGGKKNENQLTATDVFNLSLIDKAVECAKLATPFIRPAKVGGESVYVMYLHPTQVTALRTNTEAGQWLDIQQSIYAGSRADNPIFSGSLGMYNGVVLRESPYICPACDLSGDTIPNVRRAVLLGAQAAVIAFGRDRGPDRYQIREELFDYGRELGVAVKTIYGVKKTVFNQTDFGCITVSTYAAPSWK